MLNSDAKKQRRSSYLAAALVFLFIAFYYYDLNGNQVSKVKEYLVDEEGPGEADYELIAGLEETELYGYNGLNQLVEVWKDEETYTYAYNVAGIRVSKDDGTTETRFVLDGGNVILELVDDEVTANYVRGMNLIYAEIDGSTCYYLYNAHGDVTDLTTTTGAVVKSYDYDAFGNEKAPSANDTNPFRYCGEYWDDETGTYYLRARYYNPSIGRFSQQDPILDGLNWYAYCHSNPVFFCDPSGLDAFIIALEEWGAETYNNKQTLLDYGYSEDEIHIMTATSLEEFIAAWNSLGTTKDGKTVSIDVVIINTHGSPVNLSSKKTNWRITSEDISTLEHKDMGALILFACNAGHLDYADSNPAYEFAQIVNGAPVLASDGTVNASRKFLVVGDYKYWSRYDQAFKDWRKKSENGVLRDNKGWIIYRNENGMTTTSDSQGITLTLMDMLEILSI